MTNVWRLLFLVMVFLGLNVVTHRVEAQSACTVNTYCYPATKITWTYSYETDGKYFPSAQAAAQDWFAQFMSSSANVSEYCTRGCYLVTYYPESSGPYTYYNYGAAYAYTTNAQGVATYTEAGASLNSSGSCQNSDTAEVMVNNDIEQWQCIANHHAGSSSSLAMGYSDLYNKENANATTPDPISLGNDTLTDYKVDYKNNSPFPIVWTRFYQWAAYGAYNPIWTWNYDRTATLSTTSATTAFILLRREDQQNLSLIGTRPDANSNWTWSLYIPSNTTMYNAFLATGTSNQPLTTFQLKTKNNEVETYNLATGTLSEIQDVHGNYLNFTYNNFNCLTKITDNAGRYLNIKYTDNIQQGESPTGQLDSNGNPIMSPYTYYNNLVDSTAGMLVSSVTDGTTTIGYSYMYSGANGNGSKYYVLSTVTNADGTVFTYQYNALFGENYLVTGTEDELGNQYQNYTYTPNYNAIEYTSLGVNAVDKFGNGTMPNGTSYGISPNNNGQIQTVNRPCYACIGLPQDKTITYDTTGDPITLTDFKGNIEKRTYDTTRNLPLTITKAYGTALAQTTTYVWDVNFRLPDSITESVQTPTGAGTKVTTYTYDSSSNLTNWTSVVTGPSYTLSKSGSATYNSFGQNLTTTDSNGNVTTYTYDSQGNLIQVTNALNQSVTMGGYDHVGNIGWTQDPNGLKTEFTYNQREQITSIAKGCDSGINCHYETYNLTYTPTNLISKITSPNGTSVQYIYDTAHRNTEIDMLDTNNVILGKELLTLDAGGTVTQTTYQDGSGNTTKQKTFIPDDLDRIKTYVDQESKSFTQTRDDQNNLNSEIDPLGHGKTYLYDALNRLTTTTYTDTTKETVAYGAGSEVTGQTDGLNHTTSYTYDGFGNVVSKQSPDSGNSTFVYDLNNNLVSRTDARGRNISTTYDAINRPLVETGTSGETIKRTYDSCLNGIGHLCSIVDRTGTTSFTYDLWHRVASKTEVINGLTFTLSYTYDNSGQLTGIAYPSGKTVNQTFVNGNVTTITDAGMPVLNGATYDAWDIIQGWNWNSGRQASFQRDLDGDIYEVNYGSSTQAYLFDDALRMDAMNETNPNLSLAYGYDSRDRLTTSNVWGSYTYDLNSNRKTLLGSLGPMTYGIFTTSNQLTSLNGNAVTLDLSGNVLTENTLTMTYDDWSRMRSVVNSGSETDYGVNGLGERVFKTNGGTTFYYIYAGVGQLVGIYNASGLPLDETVYLGSRPVATVRGNSLGDVYPIETDESLTPVRVLDLNNNVVWSWEGKEPFGLSQPVSVGNFIFNLRFPGQYYDHESGLVQNGYRDYDSLSGRYMETDPLGLNAGMNDYGYVGGSPLMGSDPTGLIIRVEDDRVNTSSNEVSNPYETTVNFLQSRSPTANDAISALETSDIEYTVHLIDNGGSRDSRNTNDLYWNPSEGIFGSCTNGNAVYYSPAMILFHEFSHLFSPWRGMTIPAAMNPNYDNAEEERVITGPEAQVFFEINHFHATRKYHTMSGGRDPNYKSVLTYNPVTGIPVSDQEY